MLCCCKAFLQYRLLVGSFLAITGFSLAASTGFFGAGVASICQVKSNVVKSLPAFLYIFFGRQRPVSIACNDGSTSVHS